MQQDPKQQTQEVYVPSSKEVKLAVLCYLMLGLIVVIQREELTPYEEYHWSQAIGRRVVMMLLVVLLLVFVLLPLIRLIPLLVFVLMIWVWWYMVYQARNQKFGTNQWGPLGVFHAIWSWFMGISKE